jgi:hypothetical protein
MCRYDNTVWFGLVFLSIGLVMFVLILSLTSIIAA